MSHLTSPLFMLILGLALVLGGVACERSQAKPETPIEVPPGALMITSRDNKFDKTELTLQAGVPVTLVVVNRGAAVHNFKITNVKSAEGKEIGTALLAGGKSEKITFTIDKPGTYTFQCDPHPAEMRGKIIVK